MLMLCLFHINVFTKSLIYICIFAILSSNGEYLVLNKNVVFIFIHSFRCSIQQCDFLLGTTVECLCVTVQNDVDAVFTLMKL